MALLAGVVGAVVGLVVGVLFTEVIFVNSRSWPDAIPIVLAVLGWLAARALVRRRRTAAPGSPATHG